MAPFTSAKLSLSLIFVHGAERAVVTRTSSQGFEAKQVAGVLAGHRIYTARSNNGNQRQEPKKGCSIFFAYILLSSFSYYFEGNVILFSKINVT